MPKIVDHEAYRATLLAGCFDLFASRGYAALTMRTIAGELKVSTGTLYHYFESKEDLFNKMVADLAGRDVDEATRRIEPMTSAGDRVAQLLGFVRDREEYFRNLLLVVLDYYRHGAPDDAEDRQEAIQAIVLRYRDAIARLLGGISNEESELLFALFAGFIVTRIILPEGDVLGSEALHGILTMLGSGVASTQKA